MEEYKFESIYQFINIVYKSVKTKWNYGDMIRRNL